jgi:GTPase SAR1 family protein
MSGNQDFLEVRNEFYRDANGILLVLDVTEKKTLDGLDMWLREANEFGAVNLPTFVVANKVKNVFIYNCRKKLSVDLLMKLKEATGLNRGNSNISKFQLKKVVICVIIFI